MTDITAEDLRAAVAAGQLTEAQAAGLKSLAETRSGLRQAEDEPFELFRGFSEIFVTVGLGILLAGAFGLAIATSIPVVMGVAIVALYFLARYFTLTRRMMLPSILLVTAFGTAVLMVAADLLSVEWYKESTIAGYSYSRFDPVFEVANAIAIAVITAGALAAWFRVFRVPFTMFLIGLTGFCLVISLTMNAGYDGDNPFDLIEGSAMAWGTLVLGLVALAGGIWFDMRDPHRLGRLSSSGFWLHLVAAPALVNTIAQTFVVMGPGLGYVLMALSLALVTLLAVVLDRRSFLTAGIGYLIFLLLYVTDRSGEGKSWIFVFLGTGLLLTLLGSFWIEARGRIMRALPDFPGKDRLPPYKTAIQAPA